MEFPITKEKIKPPKDDPNQIAHGTITIEATLLDGTKVEKKWEDVQIFCNEELGFQTANAAAVGEVGECAPNGYYRGYIRFWKGESHVFNFKKNGLP